MHELETYQLAVIAIGAICFGVYLLVIGGDWTVDNAVVVVVAFGTSAPELFTSINANLSGYPGISVGNVIGSNIANVLMVLGITAVIAPIVINKLEVKVDTYVMLAATAAMSVAIIAGILPRWGGVAMLAAIAGYLVYQYKAQKLEVDDDDDDGDSDSAGSTMPGVMLGVGILTLLIGNLPRV